MTDEIKEYIDKFYNEKSISQLAREINNIFGIEYKTHDSLRRRVSRWVNKRKNIENKNKSIDELVPRKLEKKRYYIITWEQNNSKLHKKLWNNILAYKEFLDAELCVILGTYQKTKYNNKKDSNNRWSEETKEYWDFTRHDIHKYVNILSDVNVSPTASRPLSGLDAISRDKTSILGHPKRQLKCVPTLEGAPHKALMTTMSITLPNYFDSKCGKISEFNHKFGFVIVEIANEDVFHVRQVEACNGGSFTDLYFSVDNGTVTTCNSADTLVWGDIHVGSTDPKLVESTHKLITKLNINTSVLHDLADGESVNNHIQNNPIARVLRCDSGKDNVIKELNNIEEFVYNLPSRHNIVVSSNNDTRFDRWIMNSDWKKDPQNARVYFSLSQLLLDNGSDKNVLALYLDNSRVKNKVTTLSINDSYRIKGYELSMHGDLGSNGSKGSLDFYSKLNTPCIIGHSHSPGCIGDAFCVGTSTFLRLDYNKGASSWMQAHCLIHNNGKVQHILFSKGNFTTFK